ncbi:Urocanate hydratase [Acididesulfobacillus acetoxydans]|uniref:Urocanate hydratase n=1 Tax=Acididesulfobacillus acetoxydans TaxID=1561005 RepID=A0A8S0XAP9_9FIRM|nr:Urocanate hydratase [Acididesulfobacillus acetoxydans]CEJ09594.1 Urocanate hydratase [Acididesulfobacillus acetoxydans]
MRLLLNSLDPEVAECPEELIVYGGTGKAARDRESAEGIRKELTQLKDDETLLIQSGKPVAVFPSHPFAPRVIMAGSLLVPSYSDYDTFSRLERRGLTAFGQTTASCWAYIGSQGVMEGTANTYGEVARRHFGGTLRGRWVLTAGLGGMGSAQPLGVEYNDGVVLAVEVDESKVDRRVRNSLCQMKAADLDEALFLVREAVGRKEARSVALVGNAAQVFRDLLKRGVTPDVVTDQTAAHDLLNGYVPAGISLPEAVKLRADAPEKYLDLSRRGIVEHVKAMMEFMHRGAVVFDYGNNIRHQAVAAGLPEAFEIPGFVSAYLRDYFCVGRGPFRWIALSGQPEDIYALDEFILAEFKDDEEITHWIHFAQERIPFQGLPARTCWLNLDQRLRLVQVITDLLRQGKLAAPLALTRDHMGSVASPWRETEKMPDGSDSIADWPVLGGLLNAISGASLVSIQQGGGVGVGYSLHTGMTVIVDASEISAKKAQQVTVSDVGLGIIRHADAGYTSAQRMSRQYGFHVD